MTPPYHSNLWLFLKIYNKNYHVIPWSYITSKQTNKQTNRKPTTTSSNTSFIQRRYTYDVHKNYLIFKTPHPLVHLRPKSFHPLDLGCPTSNEFPPSPLPTPTDYGTATAPCMWTNEFKIKAKRSHVTFKLTTCPIVQFSIQ